MNIIIFNDYIVQKIAKHREQMELLSLESRLWIDIAVYEHDNHIATDFIKIIKARYCLDKAIKHKNEIKRLEKVLLKIS